MGMKPIVIRRKHDLTHKELLWNVIKAPWQIITGNNIFAQKESFVKPSCRRKLIPGLDGEMSKEIRMFQWKLAAGGKDEQEVGGHYVM